MNVDGLSLEEVTRILRVAESDIEKLQKDGQRSARYAAFLEAELEAVAPECPSCLQLRRDRGGEPRAPRGQHQEDCSEGAVQEERHALINDEVRLDGRLSRRPEISISGSR